MKILVSDFDGTLVDRHLSISSQNIEMMKELQNQGHLVVICTGRNIKEFQRDQEVLNFPFDYLILNNGGHIVDNQYTTLYRKTIDKNVGIDILKKTITYPEIFSLFCDSEKTYAYQDGMTMDHFRDNAPIDIDFYDAINAVDSFEIIAFHQEDEGIEKTQECYDYIQKHHSDVEAYFNTHFVDVVPKGCSKGTGIQELTKMISSPIEAIYAIGDSYNDIPMIELADYGYTFDHANNEVKNKTKYHVRYVYEVIEDMLRGK